MAINFPSSPNTNDIYALGSRTWKFNGNSWQLLPLTAGFTGSAGTNGFTGSQGDIGFTGSASTVIGFTGSQGATGFTGSAGTNITTANLAEGVLDTDLSSVSASDDTLASAKAIKTYIDAEVAGAGGGGGGTSWQAEKTGNFTATAGEGYFINTTSAAITATLPTSATLGDEITLTDAKGTFDTNNLTVARNGHKIQGLAEDLTVSIERAGFTLVYFNVDEGWILKNK